MKETVEELNGERYDGPQNGPSGPSGPSGPAEEGIVELTIRFDMNAQAIAGFKFDPKQLRNWTFLAAILGMAKEEADMTARAMKLQAMQQMQMQAQQDAMIRKKILRH